MTSHFPHYHFHDNQRKELSLQTQILIDHPSIEIGLNVAFVVKNRLVKLMHHTIYFYGVPCRKYHLQATLIVLIAPYKHCIFTIKGFF